MTRVGTSIAGYKKIRLVNSAWTIVFMFVGRKRISRWKEGSSSPFRRDMRVRNCTRVVAAREGFFLASIPVTQNIH